MFWDFHFLHQVPRVGGTHGRARERDCDPLVLPPPTIACLSRRLVVNVPCGQCKRWPVLYFLTGTTLHKPAGHRLLVFPKIPALRRHASRAVGAAVSFFSLTRQHFSSGRQHALRMSVSHGHCGQSRLHCKATKPQIFASGSTSINGSFVDCLERVRVSIRPQLRSLVIQTTSAHRPSICPTTLGTSPSEYAKVQC